MRIDGMGRPPDPFDNVGLDDLPPKIEWLANETAKASNRGSAYDAVFAGASKGISVDQQRQAQTVQELEMKAQELAMKTAHLPRDEFNQLLVQLKQEGMREYDQPERQAYEMPNVGQSLAAIAGMIADPRNAANIAASPFQANMMKENQRFADSVQRYRDLNESRDRRYQVTKDALSIQDRADRDRQAQQQAVIDAELGVVSDRLKHERGVLLEGMKIEGRADQALMAKHYDGYYKGKDLGVRHAAWRAITASGDYSLAEPTMPTYEEDLGRAKIATEGAKQKDINNRIYWRNKETPAKIQNILASKGLKNAQTARVRKITEYMDDEFALKYTTAWGRLAVAQQNADSYANSKNKVDTGATLNEMRLLLNSQLDALTGQLALADDDAERESIELRLSAVGQELLNLNRQNIGAGQNTGAGLLDGPHMESTGGGADEVAGKKEADEIRAYINTLPASQRKQATLDARAELKKKYKGRNFGI